MTFYILNYAFNSSNISGIILYKSPVIPISAISKIGAFSLVFIAIIRSEFCIPATCCIAPEIPPAKYILGFTVVPV